MSLLNLFAGSVRRRRSPRCLNAPSAAAERLEDRTLLTAYVVDSLDDVVASDGKLTLREAVEAASTDLAVNEAAAGQGGGVVDSITFDASLAGGTLTFSGATMDVTGSLSIAGLGADQLTIDGAASRVFMALPGASLELSGVTIRGAGVGGHTGAALTVSDTVFDGNSINGYGGALYVNNNSTLAVTNSTFTGNHSDFDGGAISAEGGSTVTVTGSTFTGNTAGQRGAAIHADASTVTVTGSTFDGNTVASGFGGAICVETSSTLTVTGSTFTGNEVTNGSGGAIAALFSTLRLINSTLSGNTASTGGGIFAFLNTTTVTNSTITANTGGAGGGLHSGLATATLNNTIVIGNLDGAVASDIGGSATGSHNLIGDAATAAGLANGVNGNIVGADAADVLDPVLADNGGPTMTHALIVGGAAVNAGSNALAVDGNSLPLAFDQRGTGFDRVFDGTVDIGAVEVQSTLRRDDIAGFLNGQWWVGVSNGSGFATTLWGGWAASGWQWLGHGDFDGDGDSDVAGFRSGAWWVGLSGGSGYVTTRWTNWRADIAWADLKVGDLDGDGKDDVVARTAAGAWWGALSTGTGFGTPALWGVGVTAAGTTDIRLTDVTGDGKADLLARRADANGEWLNVGVSDGTKFDPALGGAQQFATGLASDGVAYGDFDGDGKTDVFRRQGGNDLVVTLSSGAGYAAGTGFTSTSWGTSSGTWTEVVAGDFDGDGKDDVAARSGAIWTVFCSTGTAFTSSAWGFWATGGTGWGDATVGDFDGDGKDDIAGRRGGNWWVSRSTGAAFASSLWGTWAPTGWQAVAAVSANGGLSAGSTGSDAIGASVASGDVSFRALSADPSTDTFRATSADEPVNLFWSQADEDDDFVARLLAA